MNFRVMYIQNTISKIYKMMGLDSVSFQLLYHLSIHRDSNHPLSISVLYDRLPPLHLFI